MEISSVQQSNLSNSNIVVQPTQTPEQQQERRELVRAVKKTNESEFYGKDRELQIAFDRTTKRSVVRLVDKETKEVVRQFPPEYVLRIAEDLNL